MSRGEIGGAQGEERVACRTAPGLEVRRGLRLPRVMDVEAAIGELGDIEKVLANE